MDFPFGDINGYTVGQGRGLVRRINREVCIGGGWKTRRFPKSKITPVGLFVKDLETQEGRRRIRREKQG